MADFLKALGVLAPGRWPAPVRVKVQARRDLKPGTMYVVDPTAIGLDPDPSYDKLLVCAIQDEQRARECVIAAMCIIVTETSSQDQHTERPSQP